MAYCGVVRVIAGRRERREDAAAARASGLIVLEIDAIVCTASVVEKARTQNLQRKMNDEDKLDVKLNRGRSALPIGAGPPSGVVWGSPNPLPHWHVTTTVLDSHNINKKRKILTLQ